MEEFPGNSDISKRLGQAQPPPAEEKTEKVNKEIPEKVISGNVTVRKPSFGKRFFAIFNDEGGSFAQHVVREVVIPTAKEVVVTIIRQGFDAVLQMSERKMYGEVRSTLTRPPSGTNGPIAYYRAGNGGLSGSSSYLRDNAPIYHGSNKSNVLREIICSQRKDAIALVDYLALVADRQGFATVGDLYAQVGETVRSTDEKWGWRGHELAHARVNEIRGGFLLTMPPPQPVG